jgi:hypothetical protein
VFYAITHGLVQDIVNVCHACKNGAIVAVVFPHLLASIWIFVIVVDAVRNCEATAVHPPDLTSCLPKIADQVQFDFQQQHVAVQLILVSSC